MRDDKTYKFTCRVELEERKLMQTGKEKKLKRETVGSCLSIKWERNTKLERAQSTKLVTKHFEQELIVLIEEDLKTTATVEEALLKTEISRETGFVNAEHRTLSDEGNAKTATFKNQPATSNLLMLI